jgi:hypothetical protein
MSKTESLPPMHLVACATPPQPLETAPRTALLGELAEGESWDGFWSSDEYYVRRTESNGEVTWYQLADDARKRTPRGTEKQEARVLTFRARPYMRWRTTLVFAKSPSGRRMLVGSGRRSPRQ